MSTEDTIYGMLEALEAGDFDTAASYLAPDFEFTRRTQPDPLGPQQWIGLSMGLKAAFPDLSYNFNVEGIDGNTGQVSSQITGTHNGDFDLTAMGMGVIPATGIAVSAPRCSRRCPMVDTEGEPRQLPLTSPWRRDEPGSGTEKR